MRRIRTFDQVGCRRGANSIADLPCGHRPSPSPSVHAVRCDTPGDGMSARGDPLLRAARSGEPETWGRSPLDPRVNSTDRSALTIEYCKSDCCCDTADSSTSQTLEDHRQPLRDGKVQNPPQLVSPGDSPECLILGFIDVPPNECVHIGRTIHARTSPVSKTSLATR